MLEYLKTDYKEFNPVNVLELNDLMNYQLENGLDFPELPLLIKNDNKISGTNSIVLNLCLNNNQKKLLGKDRKEEIKHRMVMGVLSEMNSDLIKLNLEESNENVEEKIS